MFSFFFFNDTATTEIYTLSLHDALPISRRRRRLRGLRDARDRLLHARGLPRGRRRSVFGRGRRRRTRSRNSRAGERQRSEEHTSELQSRPHLVCRLLLEKKKKQ